MFDTQNSLDQLLFGGMRTYFAVTLLDLLLLSQKSLVMRIRIAYNSNNKAVLEEGQISHFPYGL